MRIGIVAIVGGLLGITGLVGCKTGAGDVVGPFPPDIRAVNLTAASLAEKSGLAEGQTFREQRVAQLAAAEIHALQTTGDVKPYQRRKHDQVFMVVQGKCISEVAGIRDILGPGGAVVVPRGETIRFVRPDAEAGKPVVLLRITLPRDDVQDAKAVELPKPVRDQQAEDEEDEPPAAKGAEPAVQEAPEAE